MIILFPFTMLYIRKVMIQKKVGDIYLIFEKMDTDLYKIMKSGQELSDDHYKFIIYQIIRALFFMHSGNIIHRDLKPSNILINEDCTIKLCDFGLSRSLSDKKDRMNLTEYVVTRYYRAPEVMLCSHQYSKSVDIWSAGCTFAELLNRKYLFPGDNYLTQIKLILECLGTQSDEDLHFVTNGHAKNYVMSFKKIPKKPMNKVVKYGNPEAIDLLERMLVFNPNKRLSIEEALNHPYIQNIKEEGVLDPKFEGNLNLDFDYDNNITRDQLIKILIQELSSFDSGIIN